jgi:hypothetical protein
MIEAASASGLFQDTRVKRFDLHDLLHWLQDVIATHPSTVWDRGALEHAARAPAGSP